MIQLSSYQTHQLREAIGQKYQMPIRNQADCILLSHFIEENTGKQVDSHTLRRFSELSSGRVIPEQRPWIF